MKTSGNTVLVTGGSSGIGLALAEKLLGSGNTVIVCARGRDLLDDAKRRFPALHIKVCDVSKEQERRELCGWAEKNFPGLNILVNNAGIQRPINFKNGIEELLKNDDEIEINFKSQVYLAARFIPMLSRQKESAIVNVSSGLGFAPMAMFPIYSATKAAMHSFSLSLRHQLKATSIKVFEAIPPYVYDTNLKGRKMEKSDWGISASEMADEIMKGLSKDNYEIPAGTAKTLANASRSELDETFKNINNRQRF